MESNNIKIEKYQYKTQKLCEDLLIIKEKLQVINKMFNDVEDNEVKFFVCNNIIDKICNLNKRVIGNNDLILLVSSLRYTFEVLITTKLFIKEPNYIYKVYYSIYLHHENKLDTIIKRAKKECVFLEKLEKEEEDLVINSATSEELRTKDIFSIMNKKANERISFFLDNVEVNGFGYHKYLIESQIIPKYENQLEEIKKLKNEKARELSKSENMNNLFDIRRQSTKVFKEIIDKRSWSEKAQEVNLKEEYDLMYELTSSLLHCTSYSLFTSKFLENEDLFMMYKQMSQYLEKIIQNINTICNLDTINCLNIGE